MANARATLRTNAWDTIYTYLQTTNAITTNNIFSAWNDTLASDKGYPLVIIEPPQISYEKLSITGTKTVSEITMDISIYDDNSQDCKAMADEVTAKLLAGRNAFADVNLMNMKITDGDYNTWREGSKKIHHISFGVEFRFVST
jgi:hypothetical protein